jgi:hypothetical protein
LRTDSAVIEILLQERKLLLLGGAHRLKPGCRRSSRNIPT